MPRRRGQTGHRFPEKNHKQDLQYGSEKLKKLICMVMLSGKYELAKRIVHDALKGVLEKRPSEHKGSEKEIMLALLDEIILVAGPSVELRSKQVGGVRYPVPVGVVGHRRMILAFRLLIRAARKRSEHSMAECLAAEFLDALAGRGSAVREKENMYRMAKANMVFSSHVRGGEEKWQQ
jgi:small subunit ribosomal protein S7